MLSGLDKKDTSFAGRTANTHVLYLQLFQLSTTFMRLNTPTFNDPNKDNASNWSFSAAPYASLKHG